MRVIGGRLRGRRLTAPRWEGLRPTSDRLRETLFNVLGATIRDATCLDLCAGTGAVGLEALSRGAARVVFVDRDPRACRLIAANVRGCDIADGYAIVRSSVEEALGVERERFDVVYLDPPYDAPALDRLLDRAATFVAPGGLLVVEHSRRRSLPPRAGPLERARELRAGDSTLSFYRRPRADTELTPPTSVAPA